jgi:ubiquitin conjugation factor E4 B
MPLKIEEVVPNTELKEKIEAWIAEKKAARTRPAGQEMDTS